MRKIIIFLKIVLFVSLTASAQERRSRLSVQGFYGASEIGCGSQLRRITANFRSGRTEDIFTGRGVRGIGTSNELSEFVSSNLDFDDTDPVISVRFNNSYGLQDSFNGGCSSRAEDENAIITLTRTDCFYRRYNGFEVFPNNGGNSSYATISIAPLIDVRNGTNELINGSIELGCAEGGIDLISNATSYNGALVWEVFDPNTLTEVPHPDYLQVLKYLDEAIAEEERCINLQIPDEEKDYCLTENSDVTDAQNDVDYYEENEPLTQLVPTWRSIVGKSSSTISLTLAEIYPNPDDQRSFAGQNILLRVYPECYTGTELDYNTFSVQYLPGTPNLARAAEPSATLCSYTNDASFKLFFDRQINADEDLFINLIDADSNRSIGNNRVSAVNPNDGVATSSALTLEPDGTYSHTWNGALGAGDYSVEVTGFVRSVSGLTCQILTQDFSIAAPTQVTFTALKVRDEVCNNENNGQIRITASGGNPPYEFTLNNGGRWQSLPSTNYVVNNLSPNTYTVQVRDANGCLDKANAGDADRSTAITINQATAITHTFTGNPVTQTSGPGATNGRIRVNSVTGGIPRQDGVRQYYDYRILTTSPNLTGRADVTGFDILGLPAGVHRIRYTDANDCEQEYNLPEIVDPAPINFTITNTRNPSCAAASDGVLTIVPSGGIPPYTFTWVNSNVPTQSGIDQTIEGGEGNYSVVVTDAGTGRAERTNIRFQNIPAALTLATDVAPVLCFEDPVVVTLNATGGSGNYEYAQVTGGPLNWGSANRFSLPYSATGYSFRARDRNATVCQTDRVLTGAISRPAAMVVNVAANGIVNNVVNGAANGAISINVVGGTAPYTITWQRNGVDISNSGQSISGLQAGRYVARITDVNDCSTASGDILVTEPEALTASITNPAITCFEGSTTLTANAQGGRISNSGTYRYQWSFNGSVINGATSATLNNAIQGNYTVRVQDDFTATETSRTVTHPDVLRLTTTLTNISCFGGNNGSIILNPQGGTAPYYYALDGTNFLPVANLNNATIEGLTFGDYSITLRDVNDCEIVTPSSVTLSQPEAMVIELIANQPATTVNGTNGALDITVSLGTLPYRFNWTSATNASFNATTEDLANLSAGQYMVTVTDANNCEREATFEVVEPGPLQVQLAQEGEIFCYGEATAALVATVSGGFPIGATTDAFEFRWYRVEEGVSRLLEASNGLVRQDNLLAGIYRVEVEDVEGTQDEARFEIVQPEDLVLRIENTQAVLCYGANTGTINVTVTGGPINPSTGTYYPYAYRWTNLDDPDFEATSEDLDALPAGTYNLVVVDENLCTIALPDPIVIAQPEAPLELFNIEATNLTGFQTANGGVSLELRGGTAPYTYAWTHRDDPSFSATTQNIDQLASGTYDLVVEDANNCTVNFSQSITEPNQLTIQIQTIADVNNIQCFGETTQEPLVTITEGGTGIYTYQWYDADSPDVILFETANTPLLEAGRYVVVVTDTNNNRATARYQVMQPNLLELAGIVSNPLCHGDRTGEIEVSVTGGIPPYNYSWSNGEIIEDLSNLGAGNYSLTVTDANNCSVQQNFSIEAPTALFISDVSRVYPSSSTRNDGRITLTVGGGTLPYAFLWTNANGDIQPTSSNVLANVGSEKYSVQITDANNCVLILEDVDLFVPPALIVNVSGVNVVTCFGETTGSISAFVSGGVPYNASKQYDYQWFNAVTDDPIGEDAFLLEEIGAGRYYVSVTDAVGASSTSPVFVLEQPGILALELTADFINCGNENDWTVASNVSGGTPPYRYNWSTGITNSILENVIAESYSLTVTDSRGCTVVQNITLTVPQALETVVSGTNPTCFAGCDGGITTETLGGTPPYTYVWSNGATTQNTTNLCEGEYTVTITDAKGCYIVETLTLEAPEQLTVNLGEDITLCAGQSARLDATITDANASYSWTATNGFTSTEAIVDVNETGLYEAAVINANGCEVTGRVFVEATTDEISANFLTSSQVFVGDSFVIVDNSDPFPDNLQWELPAEALVSYQDQNYAELQFNTPGEYEITVRTQRGLCEASQTKRVVVLEKTFDAEIGPNDTGSSGDIAFEYSIYPNPSSNGAFNAQITLKAVETINIKVFQIGSNVAMINQRYGGSDAYMLSFDISRFTTGVYFVLLETEGQSQVRKLVVN